MQIKIKVIAPKGVIESQERTFNFLMKIIKKGTLIKRVLDTNGENITYVYDVTPKQYCQAVRNIGNYSGLTKFMLNNKIVKEVLYKLADKKEDVAIVTDMITNGTKIELVKGELK